MNDMNEFSIKKVMDGKGNIHYVSRELRFPRRFGEVKIQNSKHKVRVRLQKHINNKIPIKYEDIGVNVPDKSEAALVTALLVKGGEIKPTKLIKIGVANATPQTLLDKTAYQVLSNFTGVRRDFGFFPRILEKLIVPSPLALRFLVAFSRLAEKMQESKDKVKEKIQQKVPPVAFLTQHFQQRREGNQQEGENPLGDDDDQYAKTSGDGNYKKIEKGKLLNNEEVKWLLVAEILTGVHGFDEAREFYRRASRYVTSAAEKVVAALDEKITNERKRNSLPRKMGEKIKKLQNYLTSGNVFVQKTHPKNKKVLVAIDVSGSMAVVHKHSAAHRLFFISIAYKLVKRLGGDIVLFNDEFPKRKPKGLREFIRLTKKLVRLLGNEKANEEELRNIYKTLSENSVLSEVLGNGSGGETGIAYLFAYYKPHEYDAVVIITDSNWHDGTYRKLSKRMKMMNTLTFYFVEGDADELFTLYGKPRCAKCGEPLVTSKTKIENLEIVKNIKEKLGKALPKWTVFLPFNEQWAEEDQYSYDPHYCGDCAYKLSEDDYIKAKYKASVWGAYAHSMSALINKG